MLRLMCVPGTESDFEVSKMVDFKARVHAHRNDQMIVSAADLTVFCAVCMI